MRLARSRQAVAGLIALAALLMLALAPGVSRADPPHGDHGDRGDRGHDFHGGGRRDFHGGGDRGFRGHFEGDRPPMRTRGGVRFGADPRFGGPRFDRPRFAGPPHWVGRDPHWDGDGGPRPWVRPWGPHWEPHYWVGGYWGGLFWPRVEFDWDFPWFLGALPLGYQTLWWGGVPYYYLRGVYYVWSPDYDEYVVTDPPPLGDQGEPAQAAPAPSESPPGSDRGALSLFVYPKNGQSQQQTQSDRYACHEWAVGQTGFDPTNPNRSTDAATATPSNYKRAVTACLEARGYSVR